jgi:charged multivesicular body protein 4
VENEVAKAKDCLARNDKKGAMLALKRKKMVMVKLDALENNYLQIQEHILDLESLQTTTETFSAMKEAAKAQKSAMAKHNVDTVHDVLDDLQEVKDNVQAIQDAMETSSGLYSGEIDDTELEDELAALEEEDLNAELLKPVDGASEKVSRRVDTYLEKEEELPTVPKERPIRQPARASQKDREAEDLLAELAL